MCSYFLIWPLLHYFKIKFLWYFPWFSWCSEIWYWRKIKSWCFPSLPSDQPHNNKLRSRKETALVWCEQSTLQKNYIISNYIPCSFERSWEKSYQSISNGYWPKAENTASDQIRSVPQLCLTLCDAMNHSTPGLPVHHQLPEFTQTHIHRVSDAIQPSHPLSSPSPLAPNPSQHQSLFQWVNSSHEVA